MRFNKIEVLTTMTRTGLVPVFYHSDVEVTRQVVKACYAGGVRLFEFANRGDFAHEVFAGLQKWSAAACPEMILGVGSVVDAPTAGLFIQCGANFVVGPLINPDIFKVCNRRSIVYCPACATPTEISYAQELGADIVKIFPGANVGGPSFVKNIKAPMPWTNVMVTGGVEPSEENLAEWFRAGATCVGVGSALFPEALVSSGKWDEITRICAYSLGIIGKYNKFS